MNSSTWIAVFMGFLIPIPSWSMTLEVIYDKSVAVVSDNSVVCRVFQKGTYSGGIDCAIEREGSKPSLIEQPLEIKFGTLNSAIVIKKVIAGKLCYILDGERTGGISCPK